MMEGSETIHASTVALERGGAWRAVLICGRSGAGKSDLALRLIDRGARLVADDYTSVRREGERLVASAPPSIAGRIEVRGIGIVEMPALGEAEVAMLVELDVPVERMPDTPSLRTIAGIGVPAIALAPFEGSAPIKLALAIDRWGLAV